jgi:hypothetical protein
MYYYFSFLTTNEKGHKYCLELLTELSISYKSFLNNEWRSDEQHPNIYPCMYSSITFVNDHARKHYPIFLSKDEMYDEILDIASRFTTDHINQLRNFEVDSRLHIKFDKPIVVLPPKIMNECKRLSIPMINTIKNNT